MPSHHCCHLGEPRNIYPWSRAKGGERLAQEPQGLRDPQRGSVGSSPCSLHPHTQPSGSDQYKYLAAYECKSGSSGVSQSICISDTHIFLKLSPSAYALCASFFISKMDMVITRLSGSSRRGDACSAAVTSTVLAPHPLPVPPLCRVPSDAGYSISTGNCIWRLWERREMPALSLALFEMVFWDDGS